MGNNNKTKEQLLKEIDQLRVKIAELEKSESKRIKVEEALQKSETRFNEAQRLTQIGSWELDLVTNTLYWSNEIYKMFDLDPKQFGATYEAFLNNIHPDDRALVDKAYTESVKNKKPYNIVHRLLLNDGTLKFVNERCETFYDDQGNAIRSLGTVQDITGRKQTEEKIERFSRIFEDSLNEIYLFDAETLKFTQVNNAAQHNLGYTMEELQKMTPLDFKPEFTSESFAKLVEPLRKGEKEKIVFETIHQRKDQSLYKVEVHLQLLRFENKAVFVAIILDITERKQAEEQASRQTAILEAINEVFREALMCETEEEFGKVCLAVAEKLTGSKFGFFGELNPAGLMDDISISNPGWDACEMAVSDAKRYVKNMPIRGIDRSTIRDGKSRIVNRDEMATHPDRVGPPEGHPEITAFLGVPLKHEGKTIGMIGLGNKEPGYELADQEAMEALSVAIVEALRSKRAEEELKKHHEQLDEMVKERTKELEEKNKELDSALKVFVGRELTIKKLQEKIRALEG